MFVLSKLVVWFLQDISVPPTVAARGGYTCVLRLTPKLKVRLFNYEVGTGEKCA